MPEWLVTPMLAALGFFLGFFYTRTMRLAEKLPEGYTTKEDCRVFRLECHRGTENDRAEILERMVRMESKIDRLIESMLHGR